MGGINGGFNNRYEQVCVLFRRRRRRAVPDVLCRAATARPAKHAERRRRCDMQPTELESLGATAGRTARPALRVFCEATVACYLLVCLHP